MKKLIFLSLAILGMVIGSFVAIPPVNASGGICDQWVGDDGCDYADCGVCFLWNCGGSTMYVCDPPPNEH